VFGVSYGVTNHAFKEVPQHTTHFFVDVAADPLHSTTASQTTDRWLGNALDIFSHHLAMTLRTAFPKTFPTFARPDVWKMR
jgi:hypothetical protein